MSERIRQIIEKHADPERAEKAIDKVEGIIESIKTYGAPLTPKRETAQGLDRIARLATSLRDSIEAASPEVAHQLLCADEDLRALPAMLGAIEGRAAFYREHAIRPGAPKRERERALCIELAWVWEEATLTVPGKPRRSAWFKLVVEVFDAVGFERPAAPAEAVLDELYKYDRLVPLTWYLRIYEHDPDMAIRWLKRHYPDGVESNEANRKRHRAWLIGRIRERHAQEKP